MPRVDSRFIPLGTKVLLGLAAAIPTAGRAFDYWHTPEHAETISYATVFGFRFWSVMFSVASLGILTGLFMRRSYRFWPLMCAHAFTGAVYGGWLAVTLQSITLDSVRSVTAPLAGLLLNWALATNAAREWEIQRQEHR